MWKLNNVLESTYGLGWKMLIIEDLIILIFSKENSETQASLGTIS
jgi:hypothetical protein